MAKVKCGTATRSDVEKFHLVTSALKTDVEERAAAKAEAATLDTDALIALNAELMAKLRTGTATRTDTTKAKVMTSALRTRKATLDGVAKETDVDALLKRNAELMKSFKVGTATRADVEAIKAVMKRKEELDAMLVEDKARETASKLETARAELRTSLRKTEIEDTIHLIKESEKTDIVFMVDATGSMSASIDAVKTQITKVATDVQHTNPNLKLRVAFVGYRDELDGDGGNTYFDFTDSLETFVSNLGTVVACGGGDDCEDVSSGLRDVLALSWKHPTRVLFFIADAPSHGGRYHDYDPSWSGKDNHPDGDHGIPERLKQIQSMNVDVVFCRLNNQTNKMIQVMNSDLGCDFVKTLPLSDPKALASCATATVRKSMHGTLTRSGSRKRTTRGRAATGLALLPEEAAAAEAIERTYSITPTEPEWGELRPLSATLHMNEKVVDVASLKEAGPLKSIQVTVATALARLFARTPTVATLTLAAVTSSAVAKVKVATEPFAVGNLRFARFGRISDKEGYWTSCVLKDFKMAGPGVHSLERYLEEMEVNSIASALAAAFNQRFKPPPGQSVSYVLSSVAEVKTADGAFPFFFVEQHLEGEFTRYSYNTGYWEETRLSEWLLRFALWTHEITGGFMMVADLQGVHTPSGFVLTDPVVLCKDIKRFGTTNLGEEIMLRNKATAEKHLADITGADCD